MFIAQDGEEKEAQNSDSIDTERPARQVLELRSTCVYTCIQRVCEMCWLMCWQERERWEKREEKEERGGGGDSR